jgi:hypothetical protein
MDNEDRRVLTLKNILTSSLTEINLCAGVKGSYELAQTLYRISHTVFSVIHIRGGAPSP